jgi:YbgC/YbaW family acyl-CoA thioester hydrolase
MILDVEQQHTDELGHLNHVAAVRLLEQARYAWYRACGLFDPALGRFGTVVVNIDYDYRRECFLGERLRITSRGLSMGTKSMLVGHEIVKPDGQIAIEGRATSVVMDLATRRIVPVPTCVARHLAPRYQPGGVGTISR